MFWLEDNLHRPVLCLQYHTPMSGFVRQKNEPILSFIFLFSNFILSCQSLINVFTATFLPSLLLTDMLFTVHEARPQLLFCILSHVTGAWSGHLGNCNGNHMVCCPWGVVPSRKSLMIVMCINISEESCHVQALGPRKVTGLVWIGDEFCISDHYSCLCVKLFTESKGNELYNYRLAVKIQATATSNWLPVVSVAPSLKVIVTQAICIDDQSSIKANQYSKSERKTVDTKGCLSLSLFTEEFMMKSVGNCSVHTQLGKIKFIQYNQIRYKIENRLSCLGWERKCGLHSWSCTEN